MIRNGNIMISISQYDHDYDHSNKLSYIVVDSMNIKDHHHMIAS